MADNVTFQADALATPPAALKVATRQASHGGDTADIQVITLVGVTGSEGSYTVREVVIADDAAFTPGTTGVVMVGATFDDSAPDSVDEGDAGALRMSARRELYVQLRDAAGNERGLNIDGSGRIAVTVGGTVTVDGSGVTQPVSHAALTELAAAINASSQMDVNIAASAVDVMLGSDFSNVFGTAALTDGSNHLQVDIAASSVTVTVSGTVDLGVTDNAVLDAIAASVAAIDTDATTIIGHVDGIETLLGTIDTDTGNIVTSVQLLDDTVVVLGTDTYTETTSKGLALGAVRRDADTTLVNTTNEWGPLQMDANGRLKVEAFSGETLPVSLASVPSHAVTNAGTFPVQVDGAALTALQLLDDTIFVDDAGFSVGTSKVSAIGLMADETSPDSMDEGDIGIPRMTLDRQQRTVIGVTTAGGATPFYNLDVDETEDAIKASAGQLYELYLYNTTAAPIYVHLYDATTGSVTVGTTTPVMTIPVPGNGDSDGAGVVRQWPYGLLFTAAITIAATTAATGADAPGANALMASGAFK